MKKRKKSYFIPANKEQTEGIKAMQEFIKDGNPSEFFTLHGKAGTGKTTIVQEAIAPHVNRKQIIVGALAHKAKLVLAHKLIERYSSRAIQQETIASMLGMSMDLETGDFFLGSSKAKRDVPINSADIIIIDECSMVNEEALTHIMKKKQKNAKVIFLGDIGQLPPIRENANNIDDIEKSSPTFDTKNAACLLERIRQGEESPILPYADLFWYNSQANKPVTNPAFNGQRKSSATEKGSLVFSKSGNAFNNVLPFYKEAIETNNSNIIRTVVYQNKTRQKINNIVRRYLFEEKSENQFVPGDLIMFQDNHLSGDEKISNATEVQIKKVNQVTEGEWNAWKLGVSIDGIPRDLLALSEEDALKYKFYLNDLAESAKSKFGGSRIQAWKKFWIEKERFAPIDYGYAITSHKAQGSTYDITLIAEADIMAVPIADKTKSQSIYTGITRAKHLAIIMDATNDHPKELSEAMELIKYQRKSLKYESPDVRNKA